ncbi:glycosyl hydrolase BNR repeat-containing protein [Opitutus terrae PB90-1]|uniref:Glycosyl hydrolase BNR repeat-containing protein n=2 Tax=Opitutus terrae TaxID=107709 RepID=B1ZY37_OPITP|nr:glycosyl hydrolase BNR repeat-containing protein [Opitutus terrae PB90-1]
MSNRARPAYASLRSSPLVPTNALFLMARIKICLALLVLLTGVSRAGPARQHELYVCATISRNYVVGSKLTTLSGLYHRAPDGSYVHFGVNFPGIFSLAMDPRDPRVLYVASLNGALCSRDGGETWRIGTSWDMTEPKDISVDPHAPDHVYLALPDGIAVSPDRGATWPRRENGLPERGKYTQVLKVDRTRAGRALAGCESGIYLTENTAQSWRQVFSTRTTITDLRQSPHDPQHWLATTQSDGALQSQDGGLTWTRFEGVPSAEALYNVAFDAANARRFAIGSWTYGVLVTEDGGATWHERNAGLPDGHCVFRVGIDPDDGRLYAAVYKEALFESRDFGRTWQKAGLEGSTVYNFVFVPKAAQ